MKKIFTLIFGLIIFISSFCQTWEFPDTIKGEIILKHMFYTISYNPHYKIPNYSLYILTTHEVKSDTVDRVNCFAVDPLLDRRKATEPSEYNNTKYDRGHMAPAEDMSFSLISMTQCFYMSNMCPQLPGLNRGIWKSLENYVREIALQYDSICVITGPIITSDMGIIGNGVAVPTKFFKVIYIYRLHTAIAFCFDNAKYNIPKNTHTNVLMQQYQMTVQDVETISGLKFFRGLPANKIIEVKTNKKLNLD
jgi:endonuclease G